MKIRIKGIIKTTSIILTIIFCIWVYLAFVGIENKLPISASGLFGKTKEEVLQIAFEKSPVAYGYRDGIRVGIQRKSGGGRTFYFKTIEQARSKGIFINDNTWEICYKKAPFRINGLTNYWIVKFENGKVKNIKLGGYSEF